MYLKLITSNPNDQQNEKCNENFLRYFGIYLINFACHA